MAEAAERAPAPGLRARQKAERERRILRAAEWYFGRRGFAETTMEQVARRARVAVGTIYNYFPSKADLVRALLRAETRETLAAGDAVLVRAGRPGAREDAVRLVVALFDVYVDLLARHDRELLRELLAAALASPERIGRAAFEMDLHLLAQLHHLLERLAADGKLAEGVDPGQAAALLYSLYAAWLFAFAAGEEAVGVETVRAQVRSGVVLAMRGIVGRA